MQIKSKKKIMIPIFIFLFIGIVGSYIYPSVFPDMPNKDKKEMEMRFFLRCGEKNQLKKEYEVRYNPRFNFFYLRDTFNLEDAFELLIKLPEDGFVTVHSITPDNHLRSMLNGDQKIKVIGGEEIKLPEDIGDKKSVFRFVNVAGVEKLRITYQKIDKDDPNKITEEKVYHLIILTKSVDGDNDEENY